MLAVSCYEMRLSTAVNMSSASSQMPLRAGEGNFRSLLLRWATGSCECPRCTLLLFPSFFLSFFLLSRSLSLSLSLGVSQGSVSQGKAWRLSRRGVSQGVVSLKMVPLKARCLSEGGSRCSVSQGAVSLTVWRLSRFLVCLSRWCLSRWCLQ